MKPPPIVSELYPFLDVLQTALCAGQAPGVAFANAAAAYEKATGQPCPFTVVRSCPSCRHFDRGHCHRWGKDVPTEYVEQGCAEHGFVVPTVADPSVPF